MKCPAPEFPTAAGLTRHRTEPHSRGVALFFFNFVGKHSGIFVLFPSSCFFFFFSCDEAIAKAFLYIAQNHI